MCVATGMTINDVVTLRADTVLASSCCARLSRAMTRRTLHTQHKHYTHTNKTMIFESPRGLSAPPIVIGSQITSDQRSQPTTDILIAKNPAID